MALLLSRTEWAKRTFKILSRPTFITRPLPCSSSRRLLSTTTQLQSSSDEATNLPFQIFRTVPPLRTFRRNLLFERRTLGLVPTMGALHAGHISLAKQAAQENDDVMITIYVNPTQFGVSEDLSSYPRTWKSDIAQLAALDSELSQTPGAGRITAVFAPTTGVMYPTLPPTSEINGQGSFVTITPLGTLLEGASRPVFFRGVATVCMKLFNITQPDRVYLGQKDVQQTVVLKRMVKDFHLDTSLVIGPTMREPDGLALSSRNVYLGTRRRNVASVLSRALFAAREAYDSGERTRDAILAPANAILTDARIAQDALPPERRARIELDYLSLADPETMEEIPASSSIDERGAILSAALRMLPLEEPQQEEDCGLGGGVGAVRLIDNVILSPRS